MQATKWKEFILIGRYEYIAAMLRTHAENSNQKLRLMVKKSKCFVSGLKTDVFREEMYSRTFETLEDVIREAREELSTHRDIF